MSWPTCSLALLLAGVLAAGCSRAPTVARVEWTAMGTVAAVQGRGDGDLAVARATAQNAFKRVSDEFNRFDPNSTLRRLGRVSPFGQPCWDAAMRLRTASDRAFDPSWRGADDLDFGAIAKGFAVDVAAESLRGAGDDLLIDLGGNLKAVRGDWRVGVRSPSGEGVATLVTLRAGEALATSAEYFRGKHIQDGRTGSAARHRAGGRVRLAGIACRHGRRMPVRRPRAAEGRADRLLGDAAQLLRRVRPGAADGRPDSRLAGQVPLLHGYVGMRIICGNFCPLPVRCGLVMMDFNRHFSRLTLEMLFLLRLSCDNRLVGRARFLVQFPALQPVWPESGRRGRSRGTRNGRR